MKKKSNGFTLVELLVVIGIIALLISILLPALGRAQGKAKLLKCANTERQVILAVMMYAQDNNGALPRRFRKGYAAKPEYYSPHLTYFPTDELGRCGLGLLIPGPGPTTGPGAYITSPKPAYLTKISLFCNDTKAEVFSPTNQLNPASTWPDQIGPAVAGGNPRTSYHWMPHWRYSGGTAHQEAAWDKVADVKKDKCILVEVFHDPGYLSHMDFKNKKGTWNIAFIDGHVQSVTSSLVYQQFKLRFGADFNQNAWNDTTANGFDDLISILETEASGRNPYAKPADAQTTCTAATQFLKYRVLHPPMAN